MAQHVPQEDVRRQDAHPPRPTPMPPRLARAGSAAVVDILLEFGRGCASLTDLCLLRLSMSITKEGRRHRLVMPEMETRHENK